VNFPGIIPEILLTFFPVICTFQPKSCTVFPELFCEFRVSDAVIDTTLRRSEHFGVCLTLAEQDE
jgi:hypothetical protein